MSWRTIVAGTLLSLILIASLQGLGPSQASACLPGQNSNAGAAASPAAAPAGTASPATAPNDPSATAAAPAGEPATDATAAAQPEVTIAAAVPASSAADPAATPTPAADPAPAASPSVPEASAPEASGGIAGYFNYTVKAGDDLASVAGTYGTTPNEIAKASGIPASQTLYPGMVLRVPTTDPAKVEPAQRAVAVPWSEVDAMWEIGTVAQVMDVRTGNIFYVMRRGGWAHADVEPVTAQDTATILSDYGGEYSWARRPLVVTINGQRIAASQNFMPHGFKDILTNNFPGHFCIHFLGSTTHGSVYTSNGVPTLDPAHQACVKEAVGH